MMDGQAWRQTDEGLLVKVRLTPRGGRDAIDGQERLADGTEVLKARVRTAPSEGAANDALCLLLARSFGVGKRDAEIAAGHKSRLKTVLVRGKGEELMAKMRLLLPVIAMGWLAIFAMPVKAEDLDSLIRSLSCLDKRAYYETGLGVMRSQKDKAQASQLLRTYKLALELGVEGCKGTDQFLLRRSVGMINAINRQIGMAAMAAPGILKD